MNDTDVYVFDGKELETVTGTVDGPRSATVKFSGRRTSVTMRPKMRLVKGAPVFIGLDRDAVLDAARKHFEALSVISTEALRRVRIERDRGTRVGRPPELEGRIKRQVALDAHTFELWNAFPGDRSAAVRHLIATYGLSEPTP